VMRRAAAVALGAIAALAAVGGGCGGGAAGGPVTLSVYVSAPLQGERAAAGTAIENGARLALADAGGRVGGLRVHGIYLDDTAGGRWSMARTAANARRAAQDTRTIGYIGELDSGATRVSLPITNQAEIPQVSPGSTAVDLTRLPPAGEADPDRYRPSGRQTFARVVPADDVQARAAAVWAKRMWFRRATAQGDGSAFGTIMTLAFAREAAGLGIRTRVVRRLPATRAVPGIEALRARELVYYGGLPSGKAAVMLARAAQGLPPGSLLGSDALIAPAFLRAGPFQDRLRLTSPFLAPSLLPGSGQRFLRAYRVRYGPPDPAAAYGYEAMALLLSAIRRAGASGDDRGTVTGKLLATTDRHSVLGTYSIDGNGDTTLDAVSGYRVSDGLPVFPALLRVGP